MPPPPIDPTKTALLMIDFQRDFCEVSRKTVFDSSLVVTPAFCNHCCRTRGHSSPQSPDVAPVAPSRRSLQPVPG